MSFSNLDPENIPNVKSRKAIGDEFQATLVGLIDLHLLGKHIHWNLTGENFVTVHRLLDEYIGFWYDSADLVAERAVQLGYSVDGQASAVAQQGNNLEAEPITDWDGLDEIMERLKDESSAIRGRMDSVGSNDLVSQNILIGIVQEMEKQMWFIRMQLADPEYTDDDSNESNESNTDPGEGSEGDSEGDSGDAGSSNAATLEGEERHEEEQEPEEEHSEEPENETERLARLTASDPRARRLALRRQQPRLKDTEKPWALRK